MLIYTFFFFLTGYGLRCHRAIITICKLIGIKDMYAKVTGSKNLINITRALFKGLTQQVDYIPGGSIGWDGIDIVVVCGKKRYILP